jgi:glycerophosphoryl diester phosphodiesterase
MAAALAIPGCDGLEFDVRRSADGVPVLLHDETLARVQGRPDRVDSLTAEALEGYGIPALADVLIAVGRRAFLDVELKGDHDRSVVEVLASGRGADLRHAVVSSFETATLERIAGLAPAWPRWLNSETLDALDVASATELGCRGIASQWEAVHPEAIAQARAAGLEVAAWTVRRRTTFDRLSRLGVAAVCVEASALDG